MAIQACRDTCKGNRTSLAANAGLMLATQLRTTDDDGKEKRILFGNATEALKRSGKAYEAAFERWQLFTDGDTFSAVTLEVGQRLVLGLGTESVLETGLRLHYTYGTPLIPGTALKGLAAHSCNTVLGRQDREFLANDEFPTEDGGLERRSGRYYQMLFGTNESSGIITFHDAWIVPASVFSGEGLMLDVMTTHHPAYYAGENNAAPHDGEDPHPIQFLSTRGKFRILLESERGDDSADWRRFAMELLEKALEDWGVGGKTSSGYGRLVR